MIETMSCSKSETGAPQTPSDDHRGLLAERLYALQQVTEMAAGGTARLLGHTRQLEGTVDRLTRQIPSIPDPARVGLLAERMQSIQAMLDWLSAKPVSYGNPVDFAELQTGLSISRVTLVNLQDQIQQAAMLARRVRETSERLSELVGEIEILASTKARAESLLAETRALFASMEREAETPAASPDSA
jgi:hypothetical protein